MTTATLRISTPAAMPASAKRAAPQKGFWARALDAMIRAREIEVSRKLARYTNKDGRVTAFYL